MYDDGDWDRVPGVGEIRSRDGMAQIFTSEHGWIEYASEGTERVNPETGETEVFYQNVWINRESLPTTIPVGGAPAYIGYALVDEENEYLLFIDAFNREIGTIRSELDDKIGDSPLFLAPTVRHPQIEWSPDGNYIAFISREEGTYYLNTYNVQETTQTRIVDVSARNSIFDELSWSPDGKWLVYAFRTGGGGSSTQIWAVDVQEGKRYWIGNGCNPQWSLDGASIYHNPTCYVNHLERVSRDGLQRESVAPSRVRRFQLGDQGAQFSAALEAFIMVRNNAETGNMQIILIPLDGEEELIVEFPAGRLDTRYWDISPSGKYLVIFAPSPERSLIHLHAINIPEKKHIAHPKISVDNWGLTRGWTPDEQGIVIVRAFPKLINLQDGTEHFYAPPQSYLDEYGVAGGDVGLFWNAK